MPEDVLSQRAMARALGVGVATVAVAAAKGMPMSSVEDALNWRLANVRVYRRPPTNAAALPAQPAEPDPPTDTANLRVSAGPDPPADFGQSSSATVTLASGNGKDESDDGHLGSTLARLRRLEKALVEAIEQSLHSRDVARTVVLRREHAQLVRTLFDSEAKLLSILRVRSKLIDLEEAQRCLSAVLAPIAAELRALPARASSAEERAKLEILMSSLLAKVRDGITEGFA